MSKLKSTAKSTTKAKPSVQVQTVTPAKTDQAPKQTGKGTPKSPDR